MSYVVQYVNIANGTMPLTDASWVPGYPPVECIITPKPPPVYQRLLDPKNTKNIYDLLFVSCQGTFYKHDDIGTITLQGHLIISGWYQLELHGNGTHHFLALSPFLVNKDGSEGFFDTGGKFVDFNVPPTTDSSVDTDAMTQQTVTATVYLDPGYSRFHITGQGASGGFEIRIVASTASFSKIYVYGGPAIPIFNKVTANKGEEDLAIAVYTEEQTISETIKMAMYKPKIPPREWGQVLPEIIRQIGENRNGILYEYLTAVQIGEITSEDKKELAQIFDKRIETLSKLKSVLK